MNKENIFVCVAKYVYLFVVRMLIDYIYHCFLLLKHHTASPDCELLEEENSLASMVANNPAVIVILIFTKPNCLLIFLIILTA